MPGGNLEQNRKKYGGNETIVRRFALQILQGVAYLHSKSIVHHDIKVGVYLHGLLGCLEIRPRLRLRMTCSRSLYVLPNTRQPSNILVDQHGTVKLADFGASRLISSSTTVNNESMRGTPNYMAPEVIKQSSRSRKSDIWSVGCSVLRLLTGLPFWGDKKFDSQISLLYYVANLEALPALPGELSDDARSFVTACLEIDPVVRPSALELLQHPFVTQKDPAKELRSSRNNARSRAIHTAPVANAENNVSVAKRVLNSAPSQLNLPRLRNGNGNVSAAAQLLRQESYVVPPLLPNAFDLLEVRELHDVSTSGGQFGCSTVYLVGTYRVVDVFFCSCGYILG